MFGAHELWNEHCSLCQELSQLLAFTAEKRAFSLEMRMGREIVPGVFLGEIRSLSTLW